MEEAEEYLADLKLISPDDFWEINSHELGRPRGHYEKVWASTACIDIATLKVINFRRCWTWKSVALDKPPDPVKGITYSRYQWYYLTITDENLFAQKCKAYLKAKWEEVSHGNFILR